MAFRRPHLQVLDKARLEDLLTVNRDVNRNILPQAELGGVLNEHWRISPNAGACHDYAVTKRHALLARGWPSRSLLLAEVVLPSGEHHLVLVVRTDQGDLVLDNLTAGIRPWSQTPYMWVRIQSPSNPSLWSTIGRISV
jgi:predicted transglutaminase-like cysteine proteinase